MNRALLIRRAPALLFALSAAGGALALLSALAAYASVR